MEVTSERTMAFNVRDLVRPPAASTPLKKGSLLWTPHRHGRFADAVAKLGGADRATPNAILAAMKMNTDDGFLTLEVVTRHLRMTGPFLKRVEPPRPRLLSLSTPDLRRRFKGLVSQLGGVDHATPLEIWKLMNDDHEWLTVEEIERYFDDCKTDLRSRERLLRRFQSLDHSSTTHIAGFGYGSVTHRASSKRYAPYYARVSTRSELYTSGKLDRRKRFVDETEQLIGVRKRKPRRKLKLLEDEDEDDITPKNVASHLQGFHILSTVRPQSSSSSLNCCDSESTGADGYDSCRVGMVVDSPALVASRGNDSSSYNNVLSEFRDLNLTPDQW